MAESQTKRDEPSSPMQSGCGFVMVTNLILYLIVVVVVFNMLNPSRLDPDYLAKRGWLTEQDLERKSEDDAFQKVREQKKEEQKLFFDNIQELNMRSRGRKTSSAVTLSEQQSRPVASSQPDEGMLPSAIRRSESIFLESRGVQMASSRLFRTDLFPRGILRQRYRITRSQPTKSVSPEAYDTLTAELASGVELPVFKIPAAARTRDSLYRPPNNTPEATQGGVKVRVPAQSEPPAETNRVENASSQPQPAQ